MNEIEYVNELQFMYLGDMIDRWGNAIPHEDGEDFLNKLRGITFVDSHHEGYLVEITDELLAL